MDYKLELGKLLKHCIDNRNYLLNSEGDIDKGARSVYQEIRVMIDEVLERAQAEADTGENNALLPDVSLSNFFDKQQQIIGDMIAELNKKKDAIIMHRLEKLGIEMDVEAEQRRRFKRFVVEYNDKEETYWYNNGSETGLRIVTFKKPQPNFNLNEPNHTVKTEVSYY